MTHLVKNFRKQANIEFNTSVQVTYFDDKGIYNSNDYYFKFWNGEKLENLYYCG